MDITDQVIGQVSEMSEEAQRNLQKISEMIQELQLLTPQGYAGQLARDKLQEAMGWCTTGYMVKRSKPVSEAKESKH